MKYATRETFKRGGNMINSSHPSTREKSPEGCEAATFAHAPIQYSKFELGSKHPPSPSPSFFCLEKTDYVFTY